MRNCPKCGAILSNERTICLDCGEALSGPYLSAQEAAAIQREITRIPKNIKDDYLSTTRIEKLFGFLSVAGIAATIFVAVLLNGKYDNSFEIILSVPFFLASILSAFCLRLGWEIEKFRMSFRVHNAQKLEPSDWYLLMNKITIYAGFIIGALVFFGKYDSITGRNVL